MNLQQLEYIVAVDEHRHFARAAESVFITQPTLSMMIKKLEEETGIKIFDRNTQPVVPTREGEEVLRRARKILAEVRLLREYTDELEGKVKGRINIGIIPTLAPYLLPLFIRPLSKKYPELQVYVKEMVTSEIIIKLKSGELDAGLLATPLGEQGLVEHHLFYEEFFAYASKSENFGKKKYLLPRELNPAHLWLLEEGHCLRNQVFNLCELKTADMGGDTLHYEAGSIETLINLVDKYEGLTVIPHLAAMNLKPSQKAKLREFARPKPLREISLVVADSYPRKKITEALKNQIIEALPFERNLKGLNPSIFKL